jgi:hypothetical protein
MGMNPTPNLCQAVAESNELSCFEAYHARQNTAKNSLFLVTSFFISLFGNWVANRQMSVTAMFPTVVWAISR